ncbi:helix-turn-helix domain-containing protein [Nocardia transvalensis]|uniref:helix-turn-helix domain-containing protein n=1 Tax=Nocardia transvalensis TaxID=37333 RepID=UPI0018936C71|nr:helix-turn-helix transcriptional regulator [Nocardia transvalensis]MBF6333207.1 helix-turn-helix domain-containing protein [Nocardia transvalensis]
MAPMSPTVARWELVLRIRRRREQLGVDVASIIKALGIAKAYWSHFETDRRLIPEDKLKMLFSVLEFDAEEQSELLALRSAGKERGWWHRYGALFSEETMRLWGMEYGAESVRIYESLMVTGLLQTADYARALMSTDTTFIRQAEVDQRVEVRMKRQERLGGDDPVELNCVMSQAALLQQVGGPEVLKGQLNHLIQLLEDHENVDVRILPFTARGGLPLGGATFYLFDFDGPVLPTLAWHEFPVIPGFIEDSEKVRALNISFSQMESTALNRTDSLALIKQTAREIG